MLCLILFGRYILDTGIHLICHPSFIILTTVMKLLEDNERTSLSRC